MILYFVRHGIAEDGSFRMPDSERKLTEEGRERLHEIGTALKTMGIIPDAVISSPYVRARQTAEILCKQMEFPGEILFDARIIPSGSLGGLRDLLQENSGPPSLMLVGHNPSISEFISGICAAGSLMFEMKKGAVCCIRLHSHRAMRGELLWYAPPAILRKL